MWADLSKLLSCERMEHYRKAWDRLKNRGFFLRLLQKGCPASGSAAHNEGASSSTRGFVVIDRSISRMKKRLCNQLL